MILFKRGTKSKISYKDIEIYKVFKRLENSDSYFSPIIENEIKEIQFPFIYETHDEITSFSLKNNEEILRLSAGYVYACKDYASAIEFAKHYANDYIIFKGYIPTGVEYFEYTDKNFLEENNILESSIIESSHEIASKKIVLTKIITSGVFVKRKK